MRNKFLLILVIAVSCFFVQPVRADGILLSWSGRDVQGVTEKSFNEAKQLSADQISQKNLTVRSWADAYLLMVAASPRNNDKTLLSALTSQLTDQNKAALQGTSRLIIWERISSGEILFEGKGYQTADDLFTVAGRANWILRNLTKKNFGYVKPNTPADELAKLQQKWKRFFAGEPIEEYKNPYETTETGLEEIRSREALEALIFALKPNETKDRTTKDCLQRIYKINKVPIDETSSASLCSPDTMTHRYLAVITDVKDKHDYDWWKSWWEKSRNKLEWQRDQGDFILKN